eukprot:TRINITY_DN10459_c0_g1_i7.p1 TRINITY_DN10459_c0_g1~~TRINITY_DN10459_c0_g1_i7.p1  ORF type:complete len:495 (+),score=62.49 TRINITY_DN10459_c0_g1_i7:970-2454(+)
MVYQHDQAIRQVLEITSFLRYRVRGAGKDSRNPDVGNSTLNVVPDHLLHRDPRERDLHRRDNATDAVEPKCRHAGHDRHHGDPLLCMVRDRAYFTAGGRTRDIRSGARLEMERHGHCPRFFSFIDLFDVGEGTPNVTFARILRLTRFMRLFRLVRAVRSFHSFRILVLSIVSSCNSLAWCLCVVVFIIYMFAIFFLQGVSEHFQGPNTDESGERDANLRKFYGTVPQAMVTLFMTISGGIDWGDALDPLLHLYWFYQPVFLLYLFFMYFCVLNVMVGAIVANTAEISSRDRQTCVKHELARITEYARKVRTFFSEADTDSSGLLSWEEFEKYLSDPNVKAYFQALELDVSQAHVLFKLLDTDNSNQVGLEEFFDGCLRLKGQARSIDVNMLMYECDKVFNRLLVFCDTFEEKVGIRLNDGDSDSSSSLISSSTSCASTTSACRNARKSVFRSSITSATSPRALMRTSMCNPSRGCSVFSDKRPSELYTNAIEVT